MGSTPRPVSTRIFPWSRVRAERMPIFAPLGMISDEIPFGRSGYISEASRFAYMISPYGLRAVPDSRNLIARLDFIVLSV